MCVLIRLCNLLQQFRLMTARNTQTSTPTDSARTENNLEVQSHRYVLCVLISECIIHNNEVFMHSGDSDIKIFPTSGKF